MNRRERRAADAARKRDMARSSTMRAVAGEYVPVKVQRPLASNEADGGPWLIYDEDRHGQMMLPPSLVPEEVKALLGDRPKAYLMATLERQPTRHPSEKPTYMWAFNGEESAETPDW